MPKLHNTRRVGLGTEIVQRAPGILFLRKKPDQRAFFTSLFRADVKIVRSAVLVINDSIELIAKGFVGMRLSYWNDKVREFEFAIQIMWAAIFGRFIV
jgi:hypothetical protein